MKIFRCLGYHGHCPFCRNPVKMRGKDPCWRTCNSCGRESIIHNCDKGIVKKKQSEKINTRI